MSCEFESRGVETPSHKQNVSAGQSGFSVLEAIVATAILAAALLPFVEFQSQSARAVAALERVESRIILEQQALAGLEPLMRDFAITRTAPPGYRIAGERELARGFVRGGAGIPGRFELRLVELNLTPDATRGAGAGAAPPQVIPVILATPSRPTD